ncbi:MAG TPA: adenylate/guanylate cyclase domain-containing protein [Mycobacteriales bacterium]|nr:adenylate/guanylate cyclase domain-containing protein [Mycobacteriales bacterium]
MTELSVRSVLFTDIVGSTALQAELGDCGWRDLLLAHRAAVRSRLQRHGGFENDTAGDGFYITFPDPAEAVRCALQIVEDARDLHIEVRAGLHVGTCEVAEDRCAGLTVSIGARVAARARPSQVLVTDAVREAVREDGVVFVFCGFHELKGVPGRWPLYRALGDRSQKGGGSPSGALSDASGASLVSSRTVRLS